MWRSKGKEDVPECGVQVVLPSSWGPCSDPGKVGPEPPWGLGAAGPALNLRLKV